MQIEITAVRQPRIWMFDYGDIRNEALTGGTELVLDEFYHQITEHEAQIGDTLRMTVDTEEPECYDTCLHWTEADELMPESNWYWCDTTFMECWLCPVNQLLLGKVHDKLYVTFE